MKIAINVPQVSFMISSILIFKLNIIKVLSYIWYPHRGNKILNFKGLKFDVKQATSNSSRVLIKQEVSQQIIIIL